MGGGAIDWSDSAEDRELTVSTHDRGLSGYGVASPLPVNAAETVPRYGIRMTTSNPSGLSAQAGSRMQGQALWAACSRGRGEKGTLEH